MGISRSLFPLPRTDMTNRSRSTSPIFKPTTSPTRMPVENNNSIKDVSRILRELHLAVSASNFRGERSRDLTVARAMVRGKAIPTFTSLRNPASGLFSSCSCRSRLENIDFTVARRRRMVLAFTPAILPNHRWMTVRVISVMDASPRRLKTNA
jgi:hypothetical protein